MTNMSTIVEGFITVRERVKYPDQMTGLQQQRNALSEPNVFISRNEYLWEIERFSCLRIDRVTPDCHQRSGPSRLAGTDPSNSDTATMVCVWGCVCTRSHECVRDVFAIYDNNI